MNLTVVIDIIREDETKLLAVIDVQKYFMNDLTKDLPGNIKNCLEHIM